MADALFYAAIPSLRIKWREVDINIKMAGKGTEADFSFILAELLAPKTARREPAALPHAAKHLVVVGLREQAAF